MVQYASGSIRFSGLGSDYDFDSMISKLAAIESRQATQYANWRKDWQLRLEAIKAIRGELMNMQTTLRSLNSMSKFLIKSTTSSDDKVATATADADAMNSSYKVEVNRLATYSTWTRDTGLKKKDDPVNEVRGTFSYSYKGQYRTIEVPKGTTIEGLTRLINNDSKNPGVRAQLIQSADGIAFQLRALDSGKSNTLVIRDTTHLNGLDLALSPENYEDGENWAELTTDFTDGTDVINSTGETKTFVYTVGDVRRTIEVPDNANINDLIDLINAQDPDLASLKWNAGANAYRFHLEKENTSYSMAYTRNSNNDPEPMEQLLGYLDEFNNPVAPLDFDSPESKILPDGAPGTNYNFIVNSSDGSEPHNKSYSISVPADMTLNGLVNSLKLQLGDRADVKIVQSERDPSKYSLKVEMKDTVHRVTVEDGTLEDFAYKPPVALGWDVQHGDNARVRINDYPSGGGWMEVASNTLKSGEVIPGITFNLLKEGVTNIGVSNDTTSMTENIMKFVDAVNSFRTVLMQYTQYDSEKESVDPEYAESLFEMQKGGLLQGNYGIQTVESRLKTAVAGSATGFLPRVYDTSGYAVSGDVFSSLSQIGITTNASSGESLYGLLEINFISNAKGSKTLEEALQQDPEAVARLFAASNEGSSNSDYFHYDSHIATVTKGGTHTVEYKIDVDGNIYDAYINGQKASIDNERKVITSTAGVAKGLAVNVVEYEQIGEYKGTVSIKEGKINELLGMLEGSEGILGANGTLRNLEKNYQGIIDGIEDKLRREDERLQKWEKNMLLRFSRLETVLAKYNQMQSDLDTQMAQLGNNKK